MLKLKVARHLVNLAIWLNGHTFYHSGRAAFWLARRFYTPSSWTNYSDVYTPLSKKELVEKIRLARDGVVFYPSLDLGDEG